jgi:hypothetical protein
LLADSTILTLRPLKILSRKNHPGRPASRRTRRAGRAGSPLPAALANQRIQIRYDGAHGVTRPTIRADSAAPSGAKSL